MSTFGEKYRSCDIVHDRIVNDLRKVLSKYDSKYSITEELSRNKMNNNSEQNSGQPTQENQENISHRNIQNLNNMSDDKQENQNQSENNDSKDNKEVISQTNLKNNNVIDQMIQDYSNLLKDYQQKITIFLENNDKEKFEELVRDKFKIVTNNKKNKPDIDNKNTKLKENLRKKPIGKLDEYYSDDDIEREVNKKINKDVSHMNRIYWEEVRLKIYLNLLL